MSSRTGDVIDPLVNSGLGYPTELSVTVASRDAANIKGAHFDKVSTHLQARAVRGVVSLERVKEKCSLHRRGEMTLDLMRAYTGLLQARACRL